MSSYYLVGDLGGTKTELAAYSNTIDSRNFQILERFSTNDHESAAKLIAHFIDKHNLNVLKGIIAVAGPVINDRVTFSSSNLPWEIDRNELINELNIPDLYLINDLEAVARSIPFLNDEELYTINGGAKKNNETLAVIAPGTGLGEAFLIWDGIKYLPCISEGAHVNFGPRTSIEVGLLNYIAKKHGHVTYEMVCSGIGIPNIYDYLKEKSVLEEPAWFSELLKNTEDKTPVIINAAVGKERTWEIANETMLLFASILGAETGNLVLKTMAAGGIYLAGGIPGKILPFIDSKEFLNAYSDKGIMAEMMLDVPIHVITNTKTAILGAANHLFHEIENT